MTVLPKLELASSALLQQALAEDRFHVTEYFDDGDYDGFATEKAEAERFAAAFAASAVGPDARALVEGLDVYVTAMWPPWEIRAATTSDERLRLFAFAALQRALDQALDKIELQALDPPRSDQPAFENDPELYAALTRDRLLPLTPDRLPEDWMVSEGVFASAGEAIYPHPQLAPLRELVAELAGLAANPRLRVAVAIHPFRRTALADGPTRLLEDYWQGIQLTAENLDSLDRHDVGNPTFHAAVNREPRFEFFRPLLGTWFDWTRRADTPDDAVKRLYIREVCPATDREENPLAAVHNRELHSERDTAARRFTHVDGKVCRYPATSYAPSPNNPLADPGTPQQSRKLWRVDGELTAAEWSTLVGLHFRGNELIGEHFAAAFPTWPPAA